MITYTCEICGWRMSLATDRLHPETVRAAMNVKLIRHVAARHIVITQAPSDERL